LGSYNPAENTGELSKITKKKQEKKKPNHHRPFWNDEYREAINLSSKGGTARAVGEEGGDFVNNVTRVPRNGLDGMH